MTARTRQAAIFSNYGADPDLGELVEMFVDEMPDRITTFEQALVNGDHEALRRAAHQMKGAAGSYGFNALTRPAAALESSVHDGEPEDRIRSLLNELLELCRSVRAGEPE